MQLIPACVSGKRSVDNCCLDMQQGLRACSGPPHLLLLAEAPVDELIDGRFYMCG
jgi:hypothetical protein